MIEWLNIFVGGRLCDLGGWAKVRQHDAQATGEPCVKCKKMVVITHQGQEFIRDNGPMAVYCYPCSKKYEKEQGATTKLGSERDRKTGILRIHHGSFGKPN